MADLFARTGEHRRIATHKLRNETSIAPDQFLLDTQGRARYLGWILITVLVLLIGRAFWVQVVQNDFWKSYGEKQFLRSEAILAPRGVITDRNKSLLAISEPYARIEAEPMQYRKLIARYKPEELESLGKQLEQLAMGLKMNIAELNTILNSDRLYVMLAQDLQPQIAEALLGEGIPAVRVKTYSKRLYPKGPAIAQVVGITNKNKEYEGLELIYNERLQGRDGLASIVRAPNGNILEFRELRKALEGENINISIDIRIQQYAYEALAKMVQKTKAQDGALVMIDTVTGEILAMAGYPSFDPNTREGINPLTFRNITVTDIFEPGSTMKPFFAALALDNRVVQINDIFDVSGGQINVTGHTIYDDSRRYSRLSLSEIIQHSSNVGIVKATSALNRKEMWEMLGKLGFGQPLPLGFRSEVSGRFNDYRRWQPLDKATITFGHTLSTNLLQMARAYTVFAHGEVIQPTLQITNNRAIGRTVFSQKTINQVRAMLEATVESGTGRQAQIDGYRVAGKTGTAEKFTQKGYSKAKNISTFIGFAPVSQPRLLTAVMINEPDNEAGGGTHGGQVAAPVFAQVMEHALRLMYVKPDKAFKEQPPQIAEKTASFALSENKTANARPAKSRSALVTAGEKRAYP